jgi:hypothetical protein
LLRAGAILDRGKKQKPGKGGSGNGNGQAG